MSLTRTVERCEVLLGESTYKVKERQWSDHDKEMYSIDVKGKNGLSFTVEASRGLDISNLTIHGVNISYLSEIGVRAPEAITYEDDFQENMFFGMLTTCGLENTGPQSVDEEGSLVSKHGSQNNERAYSVDIKHLGNQLLITGEISSRRFMKHPFVTHRTITFDASENTIEVSDLITNTGERSQLCLMYHINFGEPFLSDRCIVSIPFLSARPKNDDAKSRMEDMLSIGKADENNPPLVYYLELDSNENPVSRIINPEQNIEVALETDSDSLPKLDLWKNLRTEKYVISFEPCNAFPYGRKNQLIKNEAQFLEKGESKLFKFKLHFRRIYQ